MIGDATLVDDRSLLEHYARTRDAKAFNELARRYSGLVYGTCLRVTQNPDDAQDVAQECFLELARRAGTIRSSLAGWLHKVARTRSVNAIKRDSARRNREQTAFVEDVDDAASEWADIAPLVDSAVEKLPEQLRTPVVLHYFHGLEQTQIAYHLRINQSTVSRRLDKAVDNLRKELQKAGVVVSVGALALVLTENASVAAPAALTAALGKMAITGPGAAAGAGTVSITHTTAHQVLGTVVGKLAIGTTIGIVALGIAYRITRPNPETAYAASPRVVVAASSTQPRAAVQPAVQSEVAVTPMESYRGDPFAPPGYDATRDGRRADAKAHIDLPPLRIPIGIPEDGSGRRKTQVPPPVQPVRRMSGLILNNGVAAVIESNGKSEVVVPGQALGDQLAVVHRIESNRVILRTTGENPMDVVVGLTPSPIASQLNPPSPPGTPLPTIQPRPVMVPGVPVARPGGGFAVGRPAMGGGGAMMMPAVRRGR